MVLGKQNYYQVATNVNLDCMKPNIAAMAIFTNRLGTSKKASWEKQPDNLQLRKQQDMVNLKCFDMLLRGKTSGKSMFIRPVYSKGKKFYPYQSSVDKLLKY